MRAAYGLGPEVIDNISGRSFLRTRFGGPQASDPKARNQNKMQLLGPGAAFPTSPLLRGSSTGSARSLLVNPLSSSYIIHAVVFFFVYHTCNPILRRISYMLSFSSSYIIYRRSCAARRTAADAHSWSTPSLHRISCMLTYM